MKNIKQRMLVVLCAILGASGIMAQVDVTALYLENAGFDTHYDYDASATGNVQQEMLPVEGWTNDYSVNYTIVGTYQIGTKKTFNGASVPSTNVDGLAEGGVLALSTGWEESIKLYQEVTLPKGEYSLVTAYYNSGTATSASSLFGWLPSSGNSSMSAITTFPSKQWVTDTLDFKLIIARTGKIQVGMKAAASGSANSAKLSVDYVKILSHTWDGSQLGDAVEDATDLYGDGTSNGAADLKTALDVATIVYNDSLATPEEQVVATAALYKAITVYKTLQTAYKNLKKGIDAAVKQLGDNTGYGSAELQAAIDKAQQIYDDAEATVEMLDAATAGIKAAVTTYKAIVAAHTALQTAINDATTLLGDGTGNGAAALQEAIEKAMQVANTPNVTTDEIKNATQTLKDAMFCYHVANGEGTVPTVVTNDYVARGSTVALGRSTISGVTSSSLLEQGFCWSTEPEPTVLDNRSTKYHSQNGRIYMMENLEPSTIYYVRAYAITKTYAVGYGDVKKVITLPQGKITWSYDNGADAAANERINAAVADAVNYLNTYTSITGFHTSVHYGSGTPTADCSYGGWMRVGPNASYQRTGTILHELGHGIGVGTHEIWYGGSSPLRAGSGRGDWLGDRATAVVRFLDNNTTSVMTGDGTHMWPYGVNGAHEDNGSAILYISNALIHQALGEDGLPPTGGFCTPAYVFEQEDTIKYYIKNENEKFGLYTSYLVQNEKGMLVWKEMNASTALANDSAAWYITFNPDNCYYQLRNAATGRYVTYNSAGTNGIRTIARTEPASNDNFHFMRSRIDAVIGSGDSEMRLRGYWIIHPEHKLNPTTLIAGSNGTTSTASFNLGNAATVQRWMLLTAEEATDFEAACVASFVSDLDAVIERIKTLVAVPHSEEAEGVDAAINAVLTNLETKRSEVTTAEEVTALIAIAEEAIFTFLANATPTDVAQSFDLTYMIANAAIDDAEGWSDAPTLSFSCMEYFEKTFDFNQTISNLPAGTYQLRVQAYQRPGEAVEVYNSYVAGNDNVTTQLYAGTSNVKICNIASEARTGKLGGAEVQVANIPPRYVPNNMQAASLYFAKGLYDNALTTTVKTDGSKLKIGLRSTSSSTSYWTIFDNFRLYYYGAMAEDLVNDIEEVMLPVTDMPMDVYSITGVRVRTAASTLEGLPAGIYIVGGRKVLVK